MAWSTIRKATEEDKTRLQQATDRFQTRHNLTDEELQTIIENDGNWPWEARPVAFKRLRKLYRKIVQRALRSPDAEGICYGYVGFAVR